MKFAPILAVAAVLFFGAAPLMAQEFYQSGIQMGTTSCRNASYSCADIVAVQQEIVQKANECADDRYGIDDNIMTTYSMSGEYENCVLPSRPFKNSSGREMWAICCVKKMGGDDSCELSCTRYIGQK